ncbi:hypothetical protein [Bradyrhizobium sp.]|uniref:hypothetical protein n=1 Tax=Bradyrhizobium sp. TaxID=376 RepID=UPI002389DFE0|nr:hypothetical protein [Bradyrhizobium sp.]MDE2380408.1 hypothetical protein [Bradyrhizobium sp.]
MIVLLGLEIQGRSAQPAPEGAKQAGEAERAEAPVLAKMRRSPAEFDYLGSNGRGEIRVLGFRP